MIYVGTPAMMISRSNKSKFLERENIFIISNELINNRNYN